MRKYLLVFSILLICLLINIWITSCKQTDTRTEVCEGDSLKIFTFNIRYGTADDGPNSWIHRKPILMELWGNTSADLVGVQEALHFQIKELISEFPEYDYIGVGRDDGDTLGEYSAILYKKNIFKVLKSGTFWLSDHPDSIASIDWGNACTRICTWGIFEFKFTDKKLGLFNLHLDHISQVSREKSTDLVKKMISEIVSEDAPVIISGDFNAGEDNPAILTLLDNNSQNTGGRLFFDSYRIKHPKAEHVGTFNGFKGEGDGEKIDYILTDNRIKVLKAEIIRFNKDRRYPSDHFPVSSLICF
jgi:endonuclease/exonuclease/phosphatase family metal-dependent hydrolase